MAIVFLFVFSVQCQLPTAGSSTLCPAHLAMRQCQECTRRLPEHLYKNPSRGLLCNACHRKRAKWAASGRGQSGRGKTSVHHTFLTDDLVIPDSVPDPFTFIQTERQTLVDSLKTALRIQGPVKWFPSSSVSFTKKVGDNLARITSYFNASPKILLTEHDIDAQIEESIATMLAKMNDFAENGSDYVVDNLDALEIHTAAYNPVGGSSHIPLPKFLADKRCIVNVKNADDRCFDYAVLAQLCPIKNNRNKDHSYKKHLDKLNFTGIDRPVKISSIP